ncbi:hypothetical protein [Paenarthrobacter sp. FR1]|uniref:hypothetical protein n=1 Tax=Paenarthrobacter sp. FR1 TaxID=3439548 RepID=UPI003DA2ACE8
MAPQTLTLTSQLITGSVALIAGLGGAGLTTFVNRKNTKDSMAAARLTAEEQSIKAQEQEHAAWLRDKKQEAYAAYQAEAGTLFRKVNGWYGDDEPVPSVDGLPPILGRVRLIGSEDAVLLANAMSVSVSSSWSNRVYERTYRKGGKTEEAKKQRDESNRLRTQFNDLLAKYLTVVRRELGAHGSNRNAQP